MSRSSWRKDELFRQADGVTIHLILSKRTRGLVGAVELALMKPASWLINTSRGPIVDEGALIRALKPNAGRPLLDSARAASSWRTVQVFGQCTALAS